jgi:hypothetical protein
LERAERGQLLWLDGHQSVIDFCYGHFAALKDRNDSRIASTLSRELNPIRLCGVKDSRNLAKKLGSLCKLVL